MPLLPDVTPCPGYLGTALSSSRELNHSRFSISEDDTVATADVDFTTELRARFRAVPPRRGKLGAARRPSTFAIHEDEELGRRSSPMKKLAKEGKQTHRLGTTLSQPAQRLKSSQRRPSDIRLSPEQAVAAARSWSGAFQGHSTIEPKANSSNPPIPHNNPRRRGTVYIPSEDTTLPSVFLGIFSPIKTQAQLNAEQEALGGIEAQIVKKRAPKKSLAAAPKRAPLPLHPTLRPVQETVGQEDVYSGRRGKENIPPNVKLNEEWSKHNEKPFKANDAAVRSSSKHRRSSTLDANTAALVNQDISAGGFRPKPAGKVEFGKPASTDVSIQPPELLAPAKQTRPAVKRPKTVPKQAGPQPVGESSSLSTKSHRNGRLPSQTTTLRAPLPILRVQYPLITDDVQYSHLYEDNWLDHQENAYTQLLNHLFESTRAAKDKQASSSIQVSLQQTLLRDYHTPIFSELHSRLKASIEHGALAMPRESLEKVRLDKDVGLKRKFLDLWLDTYDITALGATAEVVIGRMCFQPPVSSENGSVELHASCKGIKGDRRVLEEFLATFFIRNEDRSSDDKEQKSGITDPDGDGWRHTQATLRSFMLVLLLDRVKEVSSTFSGRLFKSDSAHKSSAAVLRALKGILLPSLGDISRPLSHLGFELQHVQPPLDEHEYKINNLATDLRDGVSLARLVEILKLYGPVQDGSSQNNLPLSAEIGVSQKRGDKWPLSRQLKFPANSKVTQLFNVQLVLDALSGNAAAKNIIQGIRAEDIVNGHRQKTLALLWALVGEYGLSSFVDAKDVTGEIGRLNSGQQHQLDLDSMLEGVQNCSERCGILLREWAVSLARLRGITINNLTTDFAGQTGYRVFEAIVDEYEGYLLVESKAGCSGEKALGGLRERLLAIGCSSQFAKVFEPRKGGAVGEYSFLFNRETTIAALAFLASRLLPATKNARAALVIQRAWRSAVWRRGLKDLTNFIYFRLQCSWLPLPFRQAIETNVPNCKVVLNIKSRDTNDWYENRMTLDCIEGWIAIQAFKIELSPSNKSVSLGFLLQMLTTLPNLTWLHLKNAYHPCAVPMFNNWQMGPVRPARFQGLQYLNSENFHSSDLTGIIANWVLIQHLVLVFCFNLFDIPDDGRNAEDLALKNLMPKEINRNQVSRVVGDFLWRCYSLRKLCLQGITNVYQPGLSVHLGPRLESLKLLDIKGRDAAIQDPVQLATFITELGANTPNLRELEIGFPEGCAINAIFQHIASNVLTLKKLEVHIDIHQATWSDEAPVPMI